MKDKDYAIEEKDMEELKDQEEKRELPEGLEIQTGACRYCGQLGQVNTLFGWSQEDIDEAVTCNCQCETAVKYKEAKERKDKAKKRITEIFGEGAEEKAIAQDTVNILLNVVDAIEEKHMKGITIDVGHGICAKVSKMAKESIKVERTENTKSTYEE